MLRRLTNVLRHMLAGFVLVLVLVLVAEFSLRAFDSHVPSTVTPRAAADLQPLLRPSERTFHELRPVPGDRRPPRATDLAGDFRVNSRGCRGAEQQTPAAPTTYRILFLGDDSISAPWLPESQTLPVLVQERMKDRTRAALECINGAVPGDCPSLARIRFRSSLAALHPDLVILHFDMSDVADDRYYRRFLGGNPAEPVCRHPAFDDRPSPGAAIRDTLDSSAIAAWLMRSTRDRAAQAITAAARDSDHGPYAWIRDDPPDLRIAILHALRPLRELQSDVEQAGGRLLVTTVPVLWQVHHGRHAGELSERYGIRGEPPYQTRLPFDVLRQYCEHHGIRFAEFSQAFAEADSPETMYSDTRPVLSPRGLVLYADQIAAFLTESPPARWDTPTRSTQDSPPRTADAQTAGRQPAQAR